MSATRESGNSASRNPLDSHFNIALVRLSRMILEEVQRLHEAVEDQLCLVRTYTAETLRREPSAVPIDDEPSGSTLRTRQVDPLETVLSTYFTLGRQILGVFDDPDDVIGELGDAYRALIDSYVELAFELMALQDDLAEADEESDGGTPDLNAC